MSLMDQDLNPSITTYLTVSLDGLLNFSELVSLSVYGEHVATLGDGSELFEVMAVFLVVGP